MAKRIMTVAIATVMFTVAWRLPYPYGRRPA